MSAEVQREWPWKKKKNQEIGDGDGQKFFMAIIFIYIKSALYTYLYRR